jgi:hypothetical protein
LWLDRHQGLALSANLLTTADSTFSSDTGFWSKDAGVTISGGAANWAATAATFQLVNTTLLTVGKYYDVTYTVTSYTAGGISFKCGTIGLSPNTRAAVGTYTERVAAAGDGRIAFYSVGASTTLSITNVIIREVQGNHLLQATSTTRPILNLDGTGAYKLTFDGVDDGLATATFTAGTLTSDMDCFVVVKRNGSARGLIFNENGATSTSYFGVWDSAGGAASADTSVGAANTYFVDGVQVGGVHNTTRVQLDTALTVGSWHVMEARDLDLSLFPQLTLGAYSSYMPSVDIAAVIICPAQSNAIRQQIRTYLGQKVGLSL